MDKNKSISSFLLLIVTLLGCGHPSYTKINSPVSPITKKSSDNSYSNQEIISNPNSTIKEKRINNFKTEKKQESRTVSVPILSVKALGNFVLSSSGMVSNIEVTYTTNTSPKSSGVKFNENGIDSNINSSDYADIYGIARYINRNHSKFNISNPFLEDNTLYFKKIAEFRSRGGSSGFSIFTGIISAISGLPIPENFYMTGHIADNGKVEGVNGLYEKFDAVVDNNGSDFCLPADNFNIIFQYIVERLEKIEFVHSNRYPFPVENRNPELSGYARELLDELGTTGILETIKFARYKQPDLSMYFNESYANKTINDTLKKLNIVGLPKIHIVNNVEELYDTVFGQEVST